MDKPTITIIDILTPLYFTETPEGTFLVNKAITTDGEIIKIMTPVKKVD